MAFISVDPNALLKALPYTGDGVAYGSGGNAVTGVGFQPDLVWLKCRPQARNHRWIDVIRGVGKHLESDNNDAEESPSSGLTAFGSDGFKVGDSGGYNNSSENFASWNWKAGTSFSNDASATSIGSIDSAGSVSETAGFSICGYTGVSSAGTIKHGLSTTPSVIIWKNRTSSNGWITYHHRNTSAPETDYLELHSVNGTNDLNTIMNDTAPTSSDFSIGTEGAVGGSNTNNFISYIFF